MRGFLIKWVVSAAALWFAVWIIPGITVDGFESLLQASLILTLLNTFIGPVITFLTLPLQVFTLGIFTLLVNGFLFFMASKMVEGFCVTDFTSAFWGALLFSIASFILNLSGHSRGKFNFYFQENHSRTSPKNDNIIDVEGHEVGREDEKKIGPGDS